ncbi:putative cytochrome P450 [Xylariaceae sp. FL1019]|nr:putative cytochrome P450 [Xylariaceae sp. FL1019]
MYLVESFLRLLPLTPAIPTVLVVSILLFLAFEWRVSCSAPPSLPETIPFISNTWQYLMDMSGFLDRSQKTLQYSGIIRFRLGLMKMYWVTGSENTRALFGSPELFDADELHLIFMRTHWGMPIQEIKMFKEDRSGRKKAPIKGFENTPHGERYWYHHHRLYAEYLSSPKYAEVLANTFFDRFSQRLEEQPLNEWKPLQLFHFLKNDMAASAIESLFGSTILELNQDLLTAYWDFDRVAGALVWGLPRLLRPHPWRIRERLHGMTARHLKFAWANFDWSGPQAECDWEPHFGSRFSRETAKWFRDSGFSDRTASGHTAAMLFGLNGNTLPLTTWALMEIIQDPDLMQAARKECMSAFYIDQSSGQRRIDIKTLLSLPLLSSICTEVLRLHVSFNATRLVRSNTTIGGYYVSEGSLVQAPSQIAHLDAATWGADGHPAPDFWASRHMKQVQEVAEETQSTFERPALTKARAARATSYFPFGGGQAMCPGRHFAKREVLMTIAMVLVRFEIRFVGWTELEGSTSPGPAQNDKRYAGTAAMPPDRDIQIDWKRLW